MTLASCAGFTMRTAAVLYLPDNHALQKALISAALLFVSNAGVHLATVLQIGCSYSLRLINAA